MSSTNTDPPFIMRLSGLPEDVALAGERLRRDFEAEVEIYTKGRKSRLLARVPQDKARAAMVAMGLAP